MTHRSRRALLTGLGAAATAPARAEMRFQAELDAFREADRRGPSPAGSLLFVGSSTIRLWPDLAATFAPTPVVQRGFGGATLAEVLTHSRLLFAPHRPRTVIIYAGENDIAEGAAPEAVVAQYRALRRRVAHDAAWIFIDLKPSPARWSLWPAMALVNERIASLPPPLAAQARVRPADWVLSADGTPDAALFLSDRLHFNAAGYARLTRAVHGASSRICHASVTDDC